MPTLADRLRAEGWQEAHDDLCDDLPNRCTHVNPHVAVRVDERSRRMFERRELPEVVRGLLNVLTCYKNLDWTVLNSDGDAALDLPLRELSPERVATSVTDHFAEAVSSRFVHDGGDDDLHAVLLDLDVPAALIESSTDGHSHLYIDVEVSWAAYERLLFALADCGVIEQGYFQASKKRRASYLRLPWVKKGQERQPDLTTVEGVQAYLERGTLPPEPEPF